MILPRAALAVFLLTIMVSCELSPGNPWTVADIQAEVVWDTDGRPMDDGSLKTAKNYRLDFESMSLSFASVQVETAVNGADTSFDPSDPPEGYSLCHNGHCHNEAGELIDYEAIILMLGSGDATGLVVTRASTTEVSVDVARNRSTQTITFGRCDDRLALCEVGPADIRAVSLTLSKAVLRVRVTHDTHFPAPGVVVDVSVPMDSKLSAVTSVKLGVDAPQKVSLRARLAITPQIWDRLEFKDFLDADGQFEPAQFITETKAAFDEGAKFSTTVSRID